MNDPLFLTLAVGLGSLPIVATLLASKQPLTPRWKDLDDVRGIILHTARAPTAAGRKALWESRYAFYREHNTGYEIIKPYSFRKMVAKPLDKRIVVE